jgi:protein SCO1/2
MPSRRQAMFAIAILTLALVIAMAALLSGGRGPAGIGEPLIGGPFALTDHNGRRVTEKDFAGRYWLAFFGYTYCPDVCPTTLQVMVQALDDMGAEGQTIQPVFITVDPERDTPELLRDYVANFSPRLVGLTGSAGDIDNAAKAFRAYYRKLEKSATGEYLMDHSNTIYLMGPDGRYVKHFSYTTDAAALAEAIAEAISSSS